MIGLDSSAHISRPAAWVRGYVGTSSGQSAKQYSGTGRFLIGLALLGVPLVSVAHGQTGGIPSEDEAWRMMSPQLSTEVVELLNEVEELRADLEALMEEFEQRQDDLQDLEDEVAEGPDRFAAAARLIEVLSMRSELLRNLVGYSDELIARLESTEQQARSLTLDPGIAAELAEEDFRSMAESMLQSEAVVELVELYESQIVPTLEVLRDPAKSARTLVEGKLREWLAQPVEIDGLRFQVKDPLPETQSLFSPEPGFTIVVEYLGGDLPKVEASGLYFRRDGTPVFDDVKFTTDIASTLTQVALTELGDAIDDLGMPINFKNIQSLGFDPDDQGRRGGIQFDLELNLALDSLPLPKFEQKEVCIFTDGTVDLRGETKLTYRDRSDTPFPIGTTPLAFHGYVLELTPKPAKMGISSTISTAAPGSGKAVGLDVMCSFGFPIRKIEFEGKLRAADDVVFGSVTDGEISPEKIRAHMAIPGDDGNAAAGGVLGKMMEVDADFEFNADGLFANGEIVLFSGPRMDLDLKILTNGHGSVTGRGEFKIGDIVSFEADIQGSFKPGMKDLIVKTVAVATVDLKVFQVDAALDITADGEELKKGELPIFVQASAMGLDISFPLPTLSPADMYIIYEKLKESVPSLYKETLRAMADFEAHVGDVLAQEELKFRKSVSDAAKRAGMDAIRTDDDAVNEALGDISTGGKQVVSAMVDAREFSGKTLTHMREQGQKDLTEFFDDPVAKVSDTATDLFTNPKKLFGGGGRMFGGLLGGDDGPSAAEKAAEARAKKEAEEKRKRHEEVDTALKDLLTAIDQHSPISESIQPVEAFISGGDSLRRRSELSLRLENAVAAPIDDQGNAELALMLRASGYRSEFNSRMPSKAIRDSGSDLRGAFVTFRNLIGENPEPKARISVPTLEHHSSLQAELIARDEIQRLVELLVPGVEIEGFRCIEEKRVAVRNFADEPVTVWFQVERRSVRDQQFVWDFRPESEGQTYRMVLPPKDYKFLIIEGSEGELDEVAQGRRLRIWAESESGERWLEQRHEAIWLVEPNPQLKGQRAYHGEKLATYTYDLRPDSGPRVFSERLVGLRNDTPDVLSVRLRYRTNVGGRVVWRSHPEESLAPGQSLWPLDDDGFRIRASRIAVQAEGERRFYGDLDQPEAIWLVEAAADGRRQYSSKKIGKHVYVFHPNLDAAVAAGRDGAAGDASDLQR